MGNGDQQWMRNSNSIRDLNKNPPAQTSLTRDFLPPNEQHKQLNGPLWCNPFLKRPLLHELPNRHSKVKRNVPSSMNACGSL
ncbi:mCG1050935 [Mus musculus]|nr:mCG1050935 [Mus musculus]